MYDGSDDHVQALIARSNLTDPRNCPADLPTRIETACQQSGHGPGAILELSWTGMHKLADGHALGTIPALLIVFPFETVIVTDRKRDIQGCRHEEWEEAIGDNRAFGSKTGEFAIQFVGAGRVPLFRLAWAWWRKMLSTGQEEQLRAARERDRILGVLTKAKARDFSDYGGYGSAGSPKPSGAATAGAAGLAAQLSELARLHETGALSAEEFASAKRRLIEGR